MLFFNIDFFGFRIRFSNLLGLQVRRAACSARRVKAHCMDLCLEPPCMELLGGAPESQDPPKTEVQTPHVGVMLALCWYILRIFRVLLRVLALLVAYFAFWNALGTILEPSGLHFHGTWDLHAHIFVGFCSGCACLRTCVKTSQKLYPPPRQREVNDFRTCTYSQQKIAL